MQEMLKQSAIGEHGVKMRGFEQIIQHHFVMLWQFAAPYPCGGVNDLCGDIRQNRTYLRKRILV